jgi:acetyl-CoA C-acetyltransferase
MPNAFLVAPVRTPIGKFLGSLSSLPATTLAARCIAETVKRSGLDPATIDDVIIGQVLQAGAGQAPARQAALQAGLPSRIPAATVNMVCGSGLRAVMLAAQAIHAGDARVVIAGGMESMSRAPHILRGGRDGFKMGTATLDDAVILDGLWCSADQCHMGQHAEYTAKKWNVSRADQDAWAFQSQQRASEAMAAGAFADEIVTVTLNVKGKETVVSTDEGPRPDTTLEGLARLKPAFDPAGAVTAGNASTLSDGAASILVIDEATATHSASLDPCRVVASAMSGGDPRDLFIAPVTAIRRLLEKTRLTVDDVDLFELNEAFASQVVAGVRELRLSPERVNVHGGAIALGHPIGASGTRVLVTLLHALRRRGLKRGLASLCLGGGNAVALLVERS